ncbi:hypothetical protein [Paraburkholderia aromaticivorans]|uniref:hypothetical protein n=1 Tax=Paraburkholderia aromaticivorans TaxID=2026199 RepID=UPI0038B6B740
MTAEYLALRYVVRGETSITVQHPVGAQLPAVGNLAIVELEGESVRVEIVTDPQFEYAQTDGLPQRLVFVNYFVKRWAGK